MYTVLVSGNVILQGSVFVVFHCHAFCSVLLSMLLHALFTMLTPVHDGCNASNLFICSYVVILLKKVDLNTMVDKQKSFMASFFATKPQKSKKDEKRKVTTGFEQVI